MTKTKIVLLCILGFILVDSFLNQFFGVRLVDGSMFSVKVDFSTTLTETVKQP